MFAQPQRVIVGPDTDGFDESGVHLFTTLSWMFRPIDMNVSTKTKLSVSEVLKSRK